MHSNYWIKTHTWFEGIRLTNIIGPLYHSTTKKRIIKQMMCLSIVKSITSLKTPESPLYLLNDSIFIWNTNLKWFIGIRLLKIIGQLYHTITKNNNYKANDVFVYSKINNKSENTRISLVLVERFDHYMK